MFRVLRPWLGVPAALLVVLLTMGAALPAALHGDASDDACEVTGAGLANGPHLQAGTGSVVSQHCGICHWLRSLRAFQTDPVAPLPRLAPAAAVAVRAELTATRLVLDPVPARAPPA